MYCPYLLHQVKHWAWKQYVCNGTVVTRVYAYNIIVFMYMYNICIYSQYTCMTLKLGVPLMFNVRYISKVCLYIHTYIYASVCVRAHTMPHIHACAQHYN